MNTNMKCEEDDKNTNKSMLNDLFYDLNEEYDPYEDTEATNNLNQSEGKMNEYTIDRSNLNLFFQEKNINSDAHKRELITKNSVLF